MDTAPVLEMTRTTYPVRLHARLEEAVEYLAAHPEVQSSDWLFRTAQFFMAPSVVLMAADDEFIDIPVDIIVDEVATLVLLLFADHSKYGTQSFRFLFPKDFVRDHRLEGQDSNTILSVYLLVNARNVIREMVRFH